MTCRLLSYVGVLSFVVSAGAGFASANTEAQIKEVLDSHSKATAEYQAWAMAHPDASQDERHKNYEKYFGEADQLYRQGLARSQSKIMAAVLRGARLPNPKNKKKSGKKGALASKPVAPKPFINEDRDAATRGPTENRVAVKRDVTTRKAEAGPVNAGAAEAVSFAGGAPSKDAVSFGGGGDKGPSFNSRTPSAEGGGADSVSFSKKKKKN